MASEDSPVTNSMMFKTWSTKGLSALKIIASLKFSVQNQLHSEKLSRRTNLQANRNLLDIWKKTLAKKRQTIIFCFESSQNYLKLETYFLKTNSIWVTSILKNYAQTFKGLIGLKVTEEWQMPKKFIRNTIFGVHDHFGITKTCTSKIKQINNSMNTIARNHDQRQFVNH